MRKPAPRRRKGQARSRLRRGPEKNSLIASGLRTYTASSLSLSCFARVEAASRTVLPRASSVRKVRWLLLVADRRGHAQVTRSSSDIPVDNLVDAVEVSFAKPGEVQAKMTGPTRFRVLPTRPFEQPERIRDTRTAETRDLNSGAPASLRTTERTVQVPIVRSCKEGGYAGETACATCSQPLDPNVEQTVSSAVPEALARFSYSF